MGGQHPSVRDPRAIDRIVFFSDAVFAIAMTLLVLAIPVPDEGMQVGEALAGNSGRFFAFALSFWVIALFWFMHFRLFRLEPLYDQRLVLINTGLLFCIAFLPYPTAVLGNAETDLTATLFYAGSLTVSALMSVAVISHVLLVSLPGRMDPQAARRIILVSSILPAAFAVTVPVAFISVTTAQWLWLIPLLIKIPWVDRRLAAGIPHHLDPAGEDPI